VKMTACHIIRFSCLFLLWWICIPAMAQQVGGPSPLIEIRYLKDSLTIEENNFAFNSISLLNKSNQVLHAQMGLSGPGYVDMISAGLQDIELKPGIAQVIPLRFTLHTPEAPAAWEPIVAEVRIRELNEISRTAFFIKPAESVQYKAVLQQPNISLLENDREVSMGIYIANTGNRNDSYLINLQPGHQLNFDPIGYVIDLAPGESRVITPRITLSPKDLLYLRKDEVTIFIKSRLGEQKMLIQHITRVGSTYAGTADQWTKMPLTVEMNLQNFFGDRRFVSFNAQGMLRFKDNGQLNVLLQTDNFYHGHTGNSHMYTLQYAKGPWRITAGSLLDYNNFLVDGMGGRVQYHAAGNRMYEVMMVKSRLGDTRQFNFRTIQPLNRQLNFSTNVFVNNDVKAGQTASLALNKLDWTLSNRTHLSLEAGGGMEKVSNPKVDTTLYGAAAGYRFDTRGQHYLLSSAVSWFDKNFPGINKGFLYQLHEARYLWGEAFTGPYYEVNKRGYNDVRDSLLRYLFNTNNREYGLRFGWYRQGLSVVLSAGVFSQLQDSASAPESRMHKLSLNASWQLTNRWTLALLATAGRVSINGTTQPVKPFGSFTNFLTLQTNRYGLQLRYEKGPYYYYEIKQYLHEPTNWQRIQVAPFVELPWQKKNLFFRLQANYLHESQQNTSYLMVYHNIQYALPKAGLDLGLTMQANVTAKEQPLFNLSIRKRLDAPVIRNRQARNFTIRLFLDKNNNGLLEEGEETINQAQVTLNNNLVITNERGAIIVSNAGEEVFVLDCSAAGIAQGWIPQQGYRQRLHVPAGQKLVLIPFIRSKTVAGKVVIIRDPNSTSNTPLSGIRVTAQSVRGESFYTLTDENGAFYFSLPTGTYTISVNRAALDASFVMVEGSKTADLENNESLNLQFEIRQNKRQINIRRE